MNLAGKVTPGAALLVVGGLVILAVPAVASAAGVVSSWANSTATEKSSEGRFSGGR
jgi:hypothetical protein